MWLFAHMVSGALAWECLKDEKKWIIWLLLPIQWFFWHWILDLARADIYHNVFHLSAWNIFFWIFNFVGILALIWFSGRRRKGWRKIFSPHILSGLGAWLIWDWEWIVYKLGGGYPHFLHEHLLNLDPTNPWSAVILECVAVFALMLAAAPRISHAVKNQKNN